MGRLSWIILAASKYNLKIHYEWESESDVTQNKKAMGPMKQGEGRSHEPRSIGMQLQKLERQENGFFPKSTALPRSWPSDVDFGLLASIPVREYMCAVLSHQVYGSFAIAAIGNSYKEGPTYCSQPAPAGGDVGRRGSSNSHLPPKNPAHSSTAVLKYSKTNLCCLHPFGGQSLITDS